MYVFYCLIPLFVLLMILDILYQDYQKCLQYSPYETANYVKAATIILLYDQELLICIVNIYCKPHDSTDFIFRKVDVFKCDKDTNLLLYVVLPLLRDG